MVSKNITLELVTVNNPDAKNLIFGQSHFIKTVEDIHEVLVSTVPGINFGLAFSEASGQKKIRTSGNSPKLIKLASDNLLRIACGHVFIIVLDNAFPINIIPALRSVPEIVHLFAATANPLEVIVARSIQGGGVLGVIDGGSPLSVENEKDKLERSQFLRTIGYKL